MYIAKVKYPYLFNHFDHKDLVAAKDTVYYFNVHGKKHVQFNKGQLIPQVIYNEIFGEEKSLQVDESVVEETMEVVEEVTSNTEEVKEELESVEESIEEDTTEEAEEVEETEEVSTEEKIEEVLETKEEKKEVKPRKKRTKK